MPVSDLIGEEVYVIEDDIIKEKEITGVRKSWNYTGIMCMELRVAYTKYKTDSDGNWHDVGDVYFSHEDLIKSIITNE